MNSKFFAIIILALLTLSGCSGGNGIPRPEDTPGWNPVEAYAKSIKTEAMNIVALAATNPREANAQADAALENFNDSADAGEYAETIAQIKEKLKAMAAGTGKVAGLKELAAKLPGDVPASAGKK